jgi:diguanylate cyclase (GGDEF)-like protein
MANTTPFIAPVSALVTSRRQTIDRTVAGLKLLPSNAAVAMKVLELKRRGDSGAADLARVISGDPSLAAKVLSVANSAAFAPVAPITRLSQAVAHIGLNNLLPLVLGVSFAGIFNKLSLPQEDQAMLWKASLLKAVTAAACVRKLPGAFESAVERECAAEEAFVAGLLQDFALPVFNTADRSAWPEFLAVLDSPDAERVARENKLYGADHATVSGICSRVLGLPELFVKISEAHHGGAVMLAGAGAGPLAIAVDAAASLPHRITSLSGKLLQAVTLRLKRTSSAPPEVLVDLAKNITEEFTRVSGMFTPSDDSSATFKQFLHNLGVEVADCLQASIMSSATEITDLKDRQRRLGDALSALEDKTQRAEFDPLTSALTRAAFLARFEKLLPMARRHGAACAIGYLDLDNFKHINDTHGHQAGDAALVATASTLTKALRDSGIVGRMGGDEFVFAMVGRPEAMDRIIASVAGRMEKVAFTCEGVSMEVGTSVGVHPMGVPAADADPQAALKAADALMYRVKKSGKGRGVVGGAVPAEREAETTPPPLNKQVA